MSNEAKQVPDEERKQEAKEPTFDEQLNAAVEQNTENLYTALLKQADEKIKAQDEQIRNIQHQQLEFRDEVAVRCYVPLITETGDNKQAAMSAYQAADVFLRAREDGAGEVEHVMKVNAD